MSLQRAQIAPTLRTRAISKLFKYSHASSLPSYCFLPLQVNNDLHRVHIGLPHWSHKYLVPEASSSLLKWWLKIFRNFGLTTGGPSWWLTGNEKPRYRNNCHSTITKSTQWNSYRCVYTRLGPRETCAYPNEVLQTSKKLAKLKKNVICNQAPASTELQKNILFTLVLVLEI